jgi:hypothetical protein
MRQKSGEEKTKKYFKIALYQIKRDVTINSAQRADLKYVKQCSLSYPSSTKSTSTKQPNRTVRQSTRQPDKKKKK